MENHVLCYVRRNKITDWKRLVLTRDKLSFIYGSNDERVFHRQLKDGGVLWVISSIPGQPPELVARLNVKAVLHINDPTILNFGVTISLLCHFSAYKWIAIGDENSEFFGHNNAEKALLNTVFETTSGDPKLLLKDATEWSSQFGYKLQRPIKVSNEGLGHIENGTKALEELASSKERSIFISWKWDDSSKELMRTLAHALADQGFMAWLDLLALPQARALKVVQRDKKKLEYLLTYGYERCMGILAVGSVNYGIRSGKSERNWTLREWQGDLDPDRVIKRIIYQPGEILHAKLNPMPDIHLSSNNSLDAAKELKNSLYV